MPARTNEFQKLVLMVQKALAPKGATIRESAIEHVPGISSGREIDILIESTVGPYSIKIAVEAKDEGRKMDSGKFESLVGKYFVEGGPKINKLVVITRSGFFAPVIQRANMLGVALFTLDQAKDVEWSGLLPQKFQLKLPTHLCGLELEPPVDATLFQRMWKSGEIFCSHGTSKGSPDHFARGQAVSNVLKQQPSLISDLERLAAESTGQSLCRVEFTPDHMHSIYFEGLVYPLTALRFNIHVFNGVGDVTYSQCKYSSADGVVTELQMAEVQVAGKKIQMMMTDGIESEQIIMRIEPVMPPLSSAEQSACDD